MTGQVLAAGINDSFAVIIGASAVLYGTPLLFAALGELLAEHPEADAQHLRSLMREAAKEHKLGKPPQAARTLFRDLRALFELR